MAVAMAVAVAVAVTVTVVVDWWWGAWRSRRVPSPPCQKLLCVLRIVGALLPQALELDRRLRLACAACWLLSRASAARWPVHIVSAWDGTGVGVLHAKYMHGVSRQIQMRF